MGVQQIEDIFSIERTNLRALLSILIIGANDECAKNRKTKTRLSRGLLQFLYDYKILYVILSVRNFG